MTNPLHRLSELGQAVWLDHISRPFIREGRLESLITGDKLKGVTSNPTIFDQALAEGDSYDEKIRVLSTDHEDPEEVFTALAVRDIQEAADVFRPLHDESLGDHGFVSLEVSPHLAYDTDGSIRMARRLWKAVDRRNVMVKIPGTLQGLEAIRVLLSEGINVNVTLLFGLSRYREVAQSFLDGLKTRLDAANAITRITSVASFFLSRIDSTVDARLDTIAKNEPSKARMAASLRGRAAIASAKLAYQIFNDVFKGEAFEQFDHFGAVEQRLLWASTSVKDPAYEDVRYVEALIGPETINTMPEKTLEAYRDHGRPELRLEEGVEEAREVFDELGKLGIEMEEVSAGLEREGVEKFIQSYDNLLGTVRDRLSSVHA